MPTAYKHRTMSEILAPAAGEKEQATTPEEGAAAPEAAKSEIPEKYQGKTVEDVIEMHRNAETRLGQVQNEVGSLRGLVTDLTALQRPAETPEAAVQEPVDVTGDDLLSDPVEAVRKIVQPEFDSLKKAKETDALETLVATEGAALIQNFPDLDATVASDEFRQFASRTPSRQADFNAAASGVGLEQIRAASRLLEDFTDFQTAAAPAKETGPTPTQQAKAVATESGDHGAPVSTQSQIFESDVIKLIQSDPATYRSPSYQSELMAAIKQGRFVKNA